MSGTTTASTPKSEPWWARYVLAGAALAVFAGATVASAFLGNDTLRTTMFTATIALASGAVGYFYQSSIGSAKKDEAFAVLAQQPATNQNVPPAQNTAAPAG